MIDYKSCDELIELLNKGDLKKLKKYISDERKKYYINNARKALKEYLKRGPSPYTYQNIDKSYYDYFEFTIRNLLLTDYNSAYFLKNAEILSRSDKILKKGIMHYSSSKIINLYEELEVNQVAVEKIIKDASGKRDKKTLIDLKTKEGKIHTFYQDEFSFAEKFLGDDVEYSISDTDIFKNGSVCLVKSKKGTGFILGRKEKEQS
jgi:hypothetical protein